MINATANAMDDIKKTSVKSFADSAYSVFFLYLSFGWYILKSSLVPHVLENIKYKTKKKTVLIVILFFLVHSCDDLSLSVQLRDQTQITHGLSSRNTAFSPRLNDGRFQ